MDSLSNLPTAATLSANDAVSLRHRVQALMPALNIEQFEINQEGLVNDVAIVNHQLVFRFAKNARAAEILALELQVLDLLRDSVGVAVPTPLARNAESVIYPFLPGQPLLRETWWQLEAAQQRAIGEQLGTFLHHLHITDLTRLDWELPTTLAPVTHERWAEIYQRVQAQVYPLLLKHQIQWAERLFASVLGDPAAFAYQPALIHGDLAPYHLLFDPAQPRLTGVLDFGVAGRGDPASDIGSLLTAYGESLVGQLQATYPHLAAFLPRARFYAQSIELQWVLLGLETGENFWYTAHLGNARDLRG